MGMFLDVAYKVLKAEQRPLTAKEITDIGQSRGLLPSSGKTPFQTMKSKLSTDILERRDNSQFMRTEKGRFALREWKNELGEHVADRYQKALFDEDIVVFPASSISKYISHIGLETGPNNSQALVRELRPLRRRVAEEDDSVIQLVSVFILRCGAKVLTHKRTKRLPESRLHGYYSMNFGGHLNPDDVAPLFNLFADEGYPMLERELREEVRLPYRAIARLMYRGLLYDDSRPVSKQHLGVVYEIELKTENFEIGERGFLMDAKFESLGEIEKRIHEFDNWSVILLKELTSTVNG
jgi:predicted NUDIX family phosphoesterase